MKVVKKQVVYDAIEITVSNLDMISELCGTENKLSITIAGSLLTGMVNSQKFNTGDYLLSYKEGDKQDILIITSSEFNKNWEVKE